MLSVLSEKERYFLVTRFQNEKFKQAATVTHEGLVIQSKSETYFHNIIVDIKLLDSAATEKQKLKDILTLAQEEMNIISDCFEQNIGNTGHAEIVIKRAASS